MSQPLRTGRSMIFRQLFECESSTYSYLVASRPGGEALLIDPVLEHAGQYVQLLRELDVRLAIAIDTHVHADHVTALGALRDAVHCSTVMGAETKAECVSRRVSDGETGRTDFQNGDPAAQYDSLFGKLLRLPGETLVYPGHDYKGWTVSTIAEERAHNPRLQARTKEAYVAQMRSLSLPHPRLMDVAVPANLACGSLQAH